MEKYLTWKQILLRYFMTIIIFAGIGGLFIYKGVSNFWGPNHTPNFLYLLSIIIGLIFWVFTALRLRQFKSTPVIICPKCKRELSEVEVRYDFALCHRLELEIKGE